MSESLVRACLARIRALEPRVRAWAFLNAGKALEQARAADEKRRGGGPLGPLHGIPVGIKDIFDTADMPTENGTALHAGRRPARDAAAVERLRASGAIILGKTVTTELATYAPGATRNPHRLTHTPGGSSSGSAAAVASGMVPLAIGSQTNGSVIRPAAFCGVVGFKPSYGLVSRHGMLEVCPSFDHVGVFATSVEDAGLLFHALQGRDTRDSETLGASQGRPVPVARVDGNRAPKFAFVKTPMWARTHPETRKLFDAIARRLGKRMVEVALPNVGVAAYEAHRRIMEAEMALCLDSLWGRRAGLSASLRGQLARGRRCPMRAYLAAVAQVRKTRAAVAGLLDEYDAILTPAAPGPAPRGIRSTGDPSFCTLWTLCGVPAIALPVTRNTHGLPLAIQAIGARNDDARLLQAASWLEGEIPNWRIRI